MKVFHIDYFAEGKLDESYDVIQASKFTKTSDGYKPEECFVILNGDSCDCFDTIFDVLEWLYSDMRDYDFKPLPFIF